MIFRDIDHKRVPLPKVNLHYTDYNAKQAIFLEGIYLKYLNLKAYLLTRVLKTMSLLSSNE